jgi:hypothetical protein
MPRARRHSRTPNRRAAEETAHHQYLRQLYYDSIAFTPEAMRHQLPSRCQPDHVGNDRPFPWNRTAVDDLATPGERAERGDFGLRYAARLLGIRRRSSAAPVCSAPGHPPASGKLNIQ